jgi:hypothetical protein
LEKNMRSTESDINFKRSLTGSIGHRVREDNLSVSAFAEPMSPEELGLLGQRLSGNKNPDESAWLVAKITEGFYGS